MEQYVLVRGKHQGFDPITRKRRMFFKGDVITLGPAAAKAFADKFKPVSVVEAEAKVAQAQADSARALAAAQTEQREQRGQQAPQQQTQTQKTEENPGETLAGSASSAPGSAPQGASGAVVPPNTASKGKTPPQ